MESYDMFTPGKALEQCCFTGIVFVFFLQRQINLAIFLVHFGRLKI